MAGIAAGIYNGIIRRNTVFLGTIFAGAFAFEMVWDRSMDKMWDQINKGRQWKDIKHKYMQGDDDEE